MQALGRVRLGGAAELGQTAAMAWPLLGRRSWLEGISRAKVLVCLPMRLPATCSAGAHVTPLQKSKMIAQCRPLHPDVACVVRGGLEHFGLLRAGGGGDPATGSCGGMDTAAGDAVTSAHAFATTVRPAEHQQHC